MAKKITSFDEFVGNQNKVRYMLKRIEKDTVPQFMIFHGNPGLGKTSLAGLIAVAVTTKYESQALKEEYTRTVMIEEKSTDSIKLFNMSDVADKEELIQNVKAEMNVGFSRTGYKFLILDEAHGMTKKAQDSILPDLGNLPKNVYVIMCTTELGNLRDAVVSRANYPFTFNELTGAETRKLIRDAIADKRLQFDASLDLVVNTIADWTGNEPRRAFNLIENFEDGSLVTTKELEVFIDMNSVPVVIEILKYLYGSMSLGMDFLDSVKFDTMFEKSLREVCKVALGHVSKSISPKDTMFIKEFMKDKDERHILRFTAEVTGLSSIVRRRVISAFMKSHVSYGSITAPQKDSGQSFRYNDLRTLEENLESPINVAQQNNDVTVKSISEYFDNALNIEE